MLKYLIFILWILIPFKSFAGLTLETYAYSDGWLSLGHYQKTYRGFKGTIGSENFYLSDNGRFEPLDELKATINLFNSEEDSKKCLFPARYLILKQHKLINSNFPSCKDFEQFKSDLKPSGITLLFTDAFMNNASSLFGHTLLRIDTSRQGTQLLAHGVNYGAYTGGYENSFLYAIYGLTGVYPGGFTTKPYYDVINTYNNLENRDIWEYNLNLEPEEIDLFVAHIWEVGQTSTPYYFFTQNCSYMLMEVFDAVRPSLQLSQKFPLQTIPLDTIKAVNAKKGFVKAVQYRPSRQRKINYRLSQMNRAQKEAFLQLVKEINGKEDSIAETANTASDQDCLQNNTFVSKNGRAKSNNDNVCTDINNQAQNSNGFSDRLVRLLDSEKADVYETAYQYVQYQYVAGKINLTDYRRQSFKLLKARNQVKAGQKFNELTKGNNPANSHDSKQISIGIGSHSGNFFQQLSFRPAYHSLIDNPYGYLYGAEINFLETVFRHYDRHDKYVLEKFDILQLASFSPINELFKPLSYKININVSRQINPKSKRAGYIANVSAAGGGTFAATQNIWFYALSSLDGAYGGALPQNQWAGVGFTGGILGKFNRFGLQAEVKKIFASSKIGSTVAWRAEAAYYLTRNTSLAAEIKHVRNYGKNENLSVVMIKQHF